MEAPIEIESVIERGEGKRDGSMIKPDHLAFTLEFFPCPCIKMLSLKRKCKFPSSNNESICYISVCQVYQNFVLYPFQAMIVLVGLSIYSYCNI